MDPTPQQLARAAAARLATGREKVGDPNIARMPDDQLGLLTYLVTHHADDIPTRHLARELEDQHLVYKGLLAELHRLGPLMIRQARKHGRTLESLAPSLGVTGRKGVGGIEARWEARAAGGPADERWWRAQQKAAREATQRSATHGLRAQVIAQKLVEHRGLWPEGLPVHWPDADDLVDCLDDSARKGRPTDGLVGYVRTLVKEMREWPGLHPVLRKHLDDGIILL